MAEFLGLLVLEVVLEAHVGAEPSGVSAVDCFSLVVHEDVQLALLFPLSFTHALLPLTLSLLLLLLFALLLLLGLAGFLLSLKTLPLDPIGLLLCPPLLLQPLLLLPLFVYPLLLLLLDQGCLFLLPPCLFGLLLLAEVLVGVPVEGHLAFVIFIKVEIVVLSFPVEVDVEGCFWEYEGGLVLGVLLL